MVVIHGYRHYVLKISDIVQPVHGVVSLFFPLDPFLHPYRVHLDIRMLHPSAVNENT